MKEQPPHSKEELEHPPARPAMTLKPFESLPETAKNQPAITNHTPDPTGTP